MRAMPICTLMYQLPVSTQLHLLIRMFNLLPAVAPLFVMLSAGTACMFSPSLAMATSLLMVQECRC
jgi:hypothetical protein